MRIRPTRLAALGALAALATATTTAADAATVRSLPGLPGAPLYGPVRGPSGLLALAPAARTTVDLRRRTQTGWEQCPLAHGRGAPNATAADLVHGDVWVVAGGDLLRTDGSCSSWRRVDPEHRRGGVTGVAVVGDTVVVLRPPDVLRSVDRGVTWTSGQHPDGWSPVTLSAHGPSTVVVAFAAAGTWCSADGGASFAAVHPTTDEVTAAAAGPDGAVWASDAAGTIAVAAGCADSWQRTPDGRALLLVGVDDAGTAWVTGTDPDAAPPVEHLARDLADLPVALLPSAGGIVDDGAGVLELFGSIPYRLTGGVPAEDVAGLASGVPATLVALGDRLVAAAANGDVWTAERPGAPWQLAVDFGGPNPLDRGLVRLDGRTALYRSQDDGPAAITHDGGASWQVVPGDPGWAIGSLAGIPASQERWSFKDNETAAYFSSDGGRHWRDARVPPGGNPLGATYDPRRRGGVAVLIDDGNLGYLIARATRRSSWRLQRAHGVPSEDVVGAIAADGSSFVVLKDGGLYRSSDGRRFRPDMAGLRRLGNGIPAYLRVPGTTRSYLAREDGLWVQTARHRQWRRVAGVVAPTALALADGQLIVAGQSLYAITRP